MKLDVAFAHRFNRMKSITTIIPEQTARCLRITLTGTNASGHWSIDEFDIFTENLRASPCHPPLHTLLEMRHQLGSDERAAIRIAHQRRWKCESRSAKSEVQSVRHSESVLFN